MEPNNDNLKWYVVSTTSGYENRVKLNLENKIKNLNLEDKITEIFFPVRQYEVTDKNGKVKIKEEKIFPNYVFIHMELNDETWHCVFNTENVINFVGPDNKPAALSKAEVEQLGKATTTTEKPKFQVGDYVKMLDGYMKGYEGRISEISEDGQEVTILAAVFGSETPVKYDITKIEKL